MRAHRTALAASILATAAAAVCAWRWLAPGRGSADLGVVHAAGMFEGVPRGVPPPGVAHGSNFLSEVEAQRLFALVPGTHVYDAFTFYRYAGGLHSELSLPAEGRSFVHHTSADGYREDFERLPEALDTFVVVTGDSHTDGLCSNHESFANVAERELAARRPGKRVEVLNAGVSGYSLYNYLGCLEKHVPLAPGAFVATLYGGNDFTDALAPWRRFHDIAPPPREASYWERLLAATKRSDLQGNAVHELFSFREHPERIEEARSAVRETVEAMARTCRNHGIRFVLVYLPMDVEKNERRGAEIREVLAKLDIGPREFRAVDALADEALALARAGGGEVLDLRTVFGQKADAYYWHDLHLSAQGHAMLAQHLVPILERILPER